MIQIEIEKITDIRDAVIEIYKNCPHQFNDNDIIDEINKGIEDVTNMIYIKSREVKKNV